MDHTLSMPTVASAPAETASVTLENLANLLTNCRVACGNSADAWLANSPLGSDSLRCIRLLLDCADLCDAAAELASCVAEANPIVLRSHLTTCALACERCVREIQLMRCPQGATCVETCRHTAARCRQALPLLPTVAAAAA